jgi:intracellular proteinase inhibitor BsuPI
MNVRNLLIPLLCLGAVAFACGPRSHSEASLVSVNIAAPLAASVAPVAHVARKTPRKEQQVRIAPSFTVSVDHKTIHFALDVTNPSKKDVELTFPDGQTHEFVVLDGVGRELYRWGEGRMFTQSVQNKTIDGGETLHVAERAALDLQPGSYVAVATLRSSNFPVQEKVSFEVH